MVNQPRSPLTIKQRHLLSSWVLAGVFLALYASGAYAHAGHTHGKQFTAHSTTALDSIVLKPVSADTDGPTGAMGVDEKLGAAVPLNLPFVTETGEKVTIESLVKGPVILSILYYKCPNACSLLLTGIAAVLRTFADDSNAAPTVISMSVDENETSADAMKAKKMAFEAIQKPYPADHWHFLTGPAASIKQTADTVGFRFIKKDNDFDHPLCLIVLSPKGKVSRYILGTDYLPMEISMSLMEAKGGVVQPTIARVLRACFSYDPKSHRFVFNILRISASVILSLLGLFIVFLIVTGQKRKRQGSSR